VVAPSDMMDNRVAAIKTGLLEAGLGGKASVMVCTIIHSGYEKIIL
jgi:delta-aminolevulinic acid dehydratase/porphobilinogen synthase